MPIILIPTIKRNNIFPGLYRELIYKYSWDSLIISSWYFSEDTNFSIFNNILWCSLYKYKYLKLIWAKGNFTDFDNLSQKIISIRNGINIKTTIVKKHNFHSKVLIWIDSVKSDNKFCLIWSSNLTSRIFNSQNKSFNYEFDVLLITDDCFKYLKYFFVQNQNEFNFLYLNESNIKIEINKLYKLLDNI